MNTHADKSQENKSQSVSNEVAQKQGGAESTFQFVDNRPEAVAQRKLQEMANNSPRALQLKAFQEMANNQVIHNQPNNLLQKKEVIQLKVKKFSNLTEEQQIEARNQFDMYKGLSGVHYNDEGEKCINDNPSTQAYSNSILEGQDVEINLKNREALLTFLGIKLVETPKPSGIDMSQFSGATYSCLVGQLGNILGNKTQGLLNGQTYQGSQMYHIEGKFPSVGKPVWIIKGDGKVQIIGMYTHPGENFKEYKIKEGIGPTRFTLK
jgi:hypothetical protein